MKKIIITPGRDLTGAVEIPGDKSISHRALMLSSIADGVSTIDNLLEGHDCIATLAIMRSLGVHISLESGRWIVKGQGRFSLCEPASILDCKNSGTTIRLMAGLLSAMPFMSILDGSDQIKSRPMDRVVTPLTAMGAKIFGRSQNRLAPLVTMPSQLTGGEHSLAVKSAQVKSAILLAGLFANQETTVRNVEATRDHTERMLSFMGAKINSSTDFVTLQPLQNDLLPIDIKIPGDISSAAFLLVAGTLKATEGITLKNVLVNKTRTGIIDALKQMGANINIENERSVGNEPVADIVVKKSDLHGATFSGDHIVRMIDEVPVLALAATQAQGTTVIKDASELRVKESNRITKTVNNLQALGADINETDDGMIIKGKAELCGGSVSSYHDHRLALAFCIAGLISKDPIEVCNSEVTDDSYPGFVAALTSLGANIIDG